MQMVIPWGTYLLIAIVIGLFFLIVIKGKVRIFG